MQLKDCATRELVQLHRMSRYFQLNLLVITDRLDFGALIAPVIQVCMLFSILKDES
jgi:hypothetical protein